MPDPVTVPPEAVSAAAERTFTEMRKHPSFGLAPEEWARGVAFDLATIALEVSAPLIAAAGRERIRQALLDGDPSPLEAAFRQFVDDEEAADCALAVRDLINEHEDTP